MPYVPTTPTVVLCEQLASAVNTAWAPVAPSAVDWDFFKRYGDADEVAAATLAGRQVIFFPTDYDWQNAVRDQDEYTHHVSCLVVERYTDAAGDVPKLWTAERVDFVHTQIVQGLRFTRGGPPSWNRFLLTLAASVQVCDVEKLITSGRLFYALVQLEFLEYVTP